MYESAVINKLPLNIILSTWITFLYSNKLPTIQNYNTKTRKYLPRFIHLDE